jgi:osmotically-inducible protein OsmY
VANHNQNGGRNVALPDENQPSWRPEDERPRNQFRGRETDDDRDYRPWRGRDSRDDDRYGERDRWRRGELRGSGLDRDLPRSTERYGRGQSGYSAGRHGDDRSQLLQGRSDLVPSAGSFEDRHRDPGVDDRFTGRGRPTYWQDRTGYELDRYSTQGSYRGRDFEPERHDLFRGNRGHDERLGYPAGSYGAGYGGSGIEDTARQDFEAERHVHRGTGPHRGKGPVGYQRTDERIREMVCESLADDDQLDASHIEVAVSQGEVTLSGTVDDRRAKRDAEDCACSVSGVRDVQNLLRVVDSSASRSNASGQSTAMKRETETPAHDKKHRA